MVKHIVMFNLNEGDARSKTERIDELRARALALGLDKLPGLLRFELLENYKEGGHDLAIYAEMESREAEAAYQTHPNHVEFAGFIRARTRDRAVVDAVVEG